MLRALMAKYIIHFIIVTKVVVTDIRIFVFHKSVEYNLTFIMTGSSRLV